MVEAVVGALALGASVAGSVFPPAATEVSQVWNVETELDALRERVDFIFSFLSDARNEQPATDFVEKWLRDLEAVANEAKPFVNEHQSGVALLKRSKVAKKIVQFNDSFDTLYKRANEHGYFPIQYSTSMQRSTPPTQYESEIVGRDNDVSNLVHMAPGNQDLPAVSRDSVKLYRLSDEANIERAIKEKLCQRPDIQQLVLSWWKNKDERGDREDGGYKDEDAMKKLEAHRNLKELTVEGFMGMEVASWITMMTNLLEIILKDCNRCEALPPLGHLPNLKKINIEEMENVKVIGSDLRGGILPMLKELVKATGARNTLYPSLQKLCLLDMPKLEEWVETVKSAGVVAKVYFLNLRVWKSRIVQG